MRPAADAFSRAAESEAVLGRAESLQQEQQRAKSNRDEASIGSKAAAVLLNSKGATARQSGKMSDALKFYLEAQQHAIGSGRPQLIETTAVNLSGLYFFQGEYEKARDVLITALDQLETESRPLVQIHFKLGHGTNRGA